MTRTIVRRVARGLLILGLLVGSGAAWAHTLNAPANVEADEDGCFSYETTLVIGPGSAFIAALLVDGSDNTTVGVTIFDSFCLEELPEGQEVPHGVSGCLVDTQSPGSVLVKYSFCDDPPLEAVTTIVPHTPEVPALSFWGLLGLVLLLVALTFVRVVRRQGAA